MPYRIEQRDGEYCVIKKVDNEVMGCHDTMEEATDHMQALYAEEKTKARWSQAYINDLPDSAFLFVEPGEKDEEGKTTPRSLRHLPIRDAEGRLDAAHLRGAISRANQVKLRDGTTISQEKAEELKRRARELLNKLRQQKEITSFSALEVIDDELAKENKIRQSVEKLNMILDNIIVSDSITDKSKAILDAVKEFESIMESDTHGKGLLDKARAVAEQISGVAEPGFYVWKDTISGTWRWEGIYSNTLRDRDMPPDTIVADAHKGFAFLVKEGLVDYPELRIWHLPGKAVIGKADRIEYRESDNGVGYAVASGFFYPEAEKYARGLAKQSDLAMSHGMPTHLIRRDDKDKSIIKAYVSKEISVLPRQYAANEKTYFIVKENDMRELSKEQKEWLLKLGYTEEDLASMSRKELDVKLKEEERKKAEGNVNDSETSKNTKDDTKDDTKDGTKDGTKDSTKNNVNDSVKDNPNIDDIRKELSDFRAEVESLVKSIGDAMANNTEQIVQITQKLAELQRSDEEKIKSKAEMTPSLSLAEIFEKSVIGKQETRVDGRTTLAKDMPEEESGTSNDVMIPLISQLINKSVRGENVNVREL